MATEAAFFPVFLMFFFWMRNKSAAECGEKDARRAWMPKRGNGLPRPLLNSLAPHAYLISFSPKLFRSDSPVFCRRSLLLPPSSSSSSSSSSSQAIRRAQQGEQRSFAEKHREHIDGGKKHARTHASCSVVSENSFSSQRQVFLNTSKQFHQGA